MITPYSIAERFVGIKEVPGAMSNPMILAMLRLDNSGITGDEVPWCSAFVNYVAWLLRLPRSKSLAARSWLGIGKGVVDPWYNDIVVLTRGSAPADPTVLNAPGHVGFFAGFVPPNSVRVLGGNQSDGVSIATFPLDKVLGYRRITD